MSGTLTEQRMRAALASIPLAKPAVRLGRRWVHALRLARGKLRTEHQLRAGWRWFDLLWKSPPQPIVICGEPDNTAIPVVMCLWNRPRRIGSVLAMLNAQVLSQPLRLLFWSNNATDHEYYMRELKAFRPGAAIASIELVWSPHNIRGMGRFIAMRRLVVDSFSGPFVMLDDDQDVPPDFIAGLLEQYRPRSIVGSWAWLANPENYWQRRRPAPGEDANYVGTGGCVCDSALVAEDGFFVDLPREGLFIEDVWMSRFARARGWQVQRSYAQVAFDHADDNQYHDLTAHKVAFWRTLQKRLPLRD